MQEGPAVNYSDYLCLDQLLNAQHPVTAACANTSGSGAAAHDEMLFIVVHQAYELWFKQILYEIDSVVRLLQPPYVDERVLSTVVERLGRVVEIQKLLLKQLSVLETMTPLDFLEFRDHLVPASGFQSLQFRLLEMRLGLPETQRLMFGGKRYTALLKPGEVSQLETARLCPTLFQVTEKWLERTPFLDVHGFDFLKLYREAVNRLLGRERAIIERNPSLDESGRRAQLNNLESTLTHFESIFDGTLYERLRSGDKRRMSYRSFLAALFIQLYRDEPILTLPFCFLTRLVEIDENLTRWRFGHIIMVQRMIGTKVGTGGSSGVSYLKAAAERHRVFTDLFNLSTFLVCRSDRPELPLAIRRSLGFSFERYPVGASRAEPPREISP